MANFFNRFQAFLEKNDNFFNHEIEEISDADVESAEVLTRMMFLSTPEDYLLFFASVILLSAKNKQTEGAHKDRHYSFKDLIASAIDASIENNENFITFCCGKDQVGRPVTYVKLLGCQFTFHEVPMTPKMEWAKLTQKPQYEEQTWIKTPLQRGASTLFNYALEQDNMTRIYMDGSGEYPKDIVFRNRRKEKQKAIATLAVACAQSAQSRQIENDEQK